MKRNIKETSFNSNCYQKWFSISEQVKIKRMAHNPTPCLRNGSIYLSSDAALKAYQVYSPSSAKWNYERLKAAPDQE